MIESTLPLRGSDDWGSGEFGASRGERTHKGIDYACYPKTLVRANPDGTVTKLGYPYGDDLSFRYVEITDDLGARHRYFYVQPLVGVGDEIMKGDIIGEAQDIAARYSKPDKFMKNHVHYEILVNDQPTDPDRFWNV